MNIATLDKIIKLSPEAQLQIIELATQEDITNTILGIAAIIAIFTTIKYIIACT